MMIIQQDIKSLSYLLSKLKTFAKYKKDNAIEFVDLSKYPDQTQIINDVIDRLNKVNIDHNIFVVFGGNRSGKTETGALIISKIFKEMSNKRIWGATFSNLTVKTIQYKLSTYLPKQMLTYADYNSIRGFKNEIVLGKNNNTLYFKTFEQDVDTWQGDSCDLIWLDEECSYEHFQEAIIRLADRQGVMLLTFTSLKGFTRLVNRLYDSNDPNVKSYTLTAKNNPYLTAESKKQLKESIDADEFESRWEGRPHLKEGLVYKEYNTAIHLIPRFDYRVLVKNNPERYKISEGIDPHTRTPHHYLMFMYDTKLDIVYIVEELKAPQESMIISEFAHLIKQIRGKLQIEYTQIDTSANSKIPSQQVHEEEDQENVYTLRSEFQKYGIFTILVSKDNQVGITEVKTRLKYTETMEESVEFKFISSKKIPTEGARLYVFNDLKGTDWEFKRYAWDSYISSRISERKEQVNDVVKKDDHYMDIMKYECIKRKIDRELLKPQQNNYNYSNKLMGY